MKICLSFDYGFDIVEMPDTDIKTLKKLRSRFDKWCYDKDNPVTFDKKDRVFNFDGKTFADWLNDSENIPAKIIDSGCAKPDEEIPCLNF